MPAVDRVSRRRCTAICRWPDPALQMICAALFALLPGVFFPHVAAALIRSEIEKWTKVAAAAGIHPE